MIRKIITSLLATCLFSLANQTLAQQPRYVIIGTGGVTGVYYPTGGSICRVLNRHRKDHGMRCGVESTLGSVYNLEKVREGDLDFGVVQSDLQYHAVMGTGPFKGKGKDTSLRSVFSLYPELFTVVAHKESGINTMDDLKNKRVNIGNEGSGQRSTMTMLMSRLGWTLSDFAKVFELKSGDQSKALCEGRFDAMIFVVGHPSASIKEATTLCGSKLISVNGSAVEAMLNDRSYYDMGIISGSMYYGNEEPTQTFGVTAGLVTSDAVADDVVYELTKAIFSDLDSFVKHHPAFQDLDKRKMVKQGLTAPLHNGALKYYKEIGLL